MTPCALGIIMISAIGAIGSPGFIVCFFSWHLPVLCLRGGFSWPLYFIPIPQRSRSSYFEQRQSRHRTQAHNYARHMHDAANHPASFWSLCAHLHRQLVPDVFVDRQDGISLHHGVIGSEGHHALISVDRYADGLSVGLAEACISMMMRRDGRI